MSNPKPESFDACREAFEKAHRTPLSSREAEFYHYEKIAWQAAWLARGKLDAEICEVKEETRTGIPCPDGKPGCAVFHIVRSSRPRNNYECIAAIKELDK